MQVPEIAVDVAVIGAGAAGLWIANRVQRMGLSVAVVSAVVGGEQTLAAQGIIHGGLKYALDGRIKPRSEAIAPMPDRWRRCIAGDGDLDLSAVKVTAETFHLYAHGSNARLTAFLASKTIASRAQKLARPPAPLAQSGTAYALGDFVIDIPSLIDALVDRLRDRIVPFDVGAIRFAGPDAVSIEQEGRRIDAQHFVIACGAGIFALAPDWLEIERRPLHQVVVKTRSRSAIFAHIVTPGLNLEPAATVTTHGGEAGSVFYVGGRIATTPDQTALERIDAVIELLALAAPDLELADAQFEVLDLDRIEPKNGQPHVEHRGNVSACLPVKLTLVPQVADAVVARLAGLVPRKDGWHGEAAGLRMQATPW